MIDIVCERSILESYQGLSTFANKNLILKGSSQPKRIQNPVSTGTLSLRCRAVIQLVQIKAAVELHQPNLSGSFLRYPIET